MKKVILSLFLLIVIVIGGGAWYLFSNLNGLVKDIIVVTGGDVLQTNVGLDTVDLQLLEGAGELRGFSISNYPGFSAERLVVVNKVRLDIDPNSLRKDVIVIEELTVSGVTVTAEQMGTKTNLQALLDRLPKDSTSNTDASTTEKPLLFAIKTLRFDNSIIDLVTEDYGSHKIKLPKIVQNNIGSTSQGLTSEQLAKEIVEPLIKRAKNKVRDEVKELAKEKLKEKYGDDVDAKKSELKGKLKDKLGNDAEEKLKGLKDLF